MKKEFMVFVVEKILKVEQTKSIIAKANLVEGNIPYVTRTVSDNGYMGACGNINKINSGNCITIGAETGVAFYQPVDFVAGNKVYRLSSDGLTEKHYLYLAGALNRLTHNYSYSNARIPEKIKKEEILLPIEIDANGRPIVDETCKYHDEGFVPDFEYMEEYIKELEKERIKELEKYLIVTGLNDYELTDEDKEVLKAFESSESGSCWRRLEKEFKAEKLFNFFAIKQAKSQKAIPTDKNGVPYIVQSTKNNMCARNVNKQWLIDNNESPTTGNCIVLGVTLPAVSYQPDKFGASQVIVARADFLNECLGLYFTTLFEKQMFRFSYSSKPSFKAYKNTIFSLPIQTDADNNPIIDAERKYHSDGYVPDWGFMERYIKAIEKVVIADVVKYKDEMIALTKKVVA